MPNWANKKEPFNKKLERLVATIDRFTQNGHTVSLVAASAGSSLALLAYMQRRKHVTRIVSICGKLRRPNTVPAALFAINPAFKAALHAYMRQEHTLTRADTNKILIVCATHDSYVPVQDGTIPHAHTHTIRSIGHVFSILLALTVYKWHIIYFLQRGKIRASRWGIHRLRR